MLFIPILSFSQEKWSLQHCVDYALEHNLQISAEKINLEREKANLQPRAILDFEQWLEEQPLTPEEQKLFRKYKSQTAKEITNK